MPRCKQYKDRVWFWCPGCNENHAVTPSTWKFNGNYDLPTFSPSILVRTRRAEDPNFPTQNVKDRVCHSFVKDGKIQFLLDSTHPLAGQTVDLPDYELYD